MLCSINPATKETFYQPKELTKAQLDAKLAKAQAAFEAWKETSMAERASLMKKAGDYLRANKTELAKIITQEVGKTLAAAEAEIEKSAITCDYYADNAEKFLTPEVIETDASESFVRFDPLGLVLAIMPWNYPFWQVFRFAAPALMAGNGGVLKHAGNVQLSAEAIEKVFVEAGFPEDLFVNLTIDVPMVETVIRDPRVMAVTLTGSEYAGTQVGKTAGEELKKVVLELGGSDPFIVLKDADIDTAATTAVAGRMQNNAGQSCIAAKRFIVQKDIAEEFLQKAKVELEKLVMGDPTKPETNVGPLVGEKAQAEIDKQVKESVAMGARIVSGGKMGPSNGFYYEPTIITDLKPGMPVYDQEVFGPVMSVIIVEDEKEALKVANSHRYGLGASIFTKDLAKAKDMARQIESGAVFINAVTKSDARLPFGGVKKSGYGRELSHYGLKEFVNVKTVWVK